MQKHTLIVINHYVPQVQKQTLIAVNYYVPQVQKQLKNGLVKIFPADRAKVETFLALGQSIMSATTVRQLMDSAFRSMRVCMGVVREWGVATEDYVGVVPTEGQVRGMIKEWIFLSPLGYSSGAV